MLAMAPVRSAAGATGYFAKDNYYTTTDAAEASRWGGQGALALGLTGAPTPEQFMRVLLGQMPDGTTIPAGVNGKRVFGSDFVFSVPKSVSLLAYVGGDTRLLEANMRAVQKTMAWAERHLATARIETDGRVEAVKTRNLVMAFFEHDTSREQEPEAHVHVVIANATKTPDGRWRALDNRPLWKANTLLGSIHMAELRAEIVKLGYDPAIVGKYGSFEIGQIPRSVIDAFSTRRQQILGAVDRLVHRTPRALDAVQRSTRGDKAVIDDHDGLYTQWTDKARALGVDLPAQVRAARDGVHAVRSPWEKAVEGVVGAAARARAIGNHFGAMIGVSPADRAVEDMYIPETAGRLGLEQRAAAQAVASAIRHLSEREASFDTHDIYKTALNFGLPITIEDVQGRVTKLEARKILVAGTGEADRFMTTAQAIRIEQQILGEVEAGRGAVVPLMEGEQAGERLQARARADAGFALNPGQEAAARLVLASNDRIIAIQGVAGAGKSTMLRPLAAELKAEGRTLLGLAFQNKMVSDLVDAGLPAQTIASFLARHQHLLEPAAPQASIDQACADLAQTFIVVDESSMNANDAQLKLNRLANLLVVPRMVMMGDHRQLGAIDAGKPFEIMQRTGIEMAVMPENLRARSEVVKAVASAFQAGRVAEAFKALSPHMTIAPDRMDDVAVEQWMVLDTETRERTGLYASGRAHKGEINRLVQEKRLEAGEIGAAALSLTVLDRVGLTSEEMRYAHHYQPGMIVEFPQRIVAQKIPAGRASVMAHDRETGRVTVKLASGTLRTFAPGRVQPDRKSVATRLYVRRELALHAGDRLRWGDNDRDRGLFNATIARLLGWDHKGVTVETSNGMRHVLPHGDPMLDKIDLAYALNAHMAQGVTSDHGIAVMDSRETRLANLRLALVTATRVRDSFSVVADDPQRLVRQLEANRGDKTSALETIGQVPTLAANAAAGKAVASDRWDAKATAALGPAKPELEKKIDDGGGRSRQVDFDL
jgi:conjugative relaxase-like TrwC/TraI family protein